MDSVLKILGKDRADLFSPGIESLLMLIHHQGCFGYGIFVTEYENQISVTCVLRIILLQINNKAIQKLHVVICEIIISRSRSFIFKIFADFILCGESGEVYGVVEDLKHFAVRTGVAAVCESFRLTVTFFIIRVRTAQRADFAFSVSGGDIAAGLYLEVIFLVPLGSLKVADAFRIHRDLNGRNSLAVNAHSADDSAAAILFGKLVKKAYTFIVGFEKYAVIVIDGIIKILIHVSLLSRGDCLNPGGCTCA